MLNQIEMDENIGGWIILFASWLIISAISMFISNIGIKTQLLTKKKMYV